jgi:hypothetical protein
MEVHSRPIRYKLLIIPKKIVKTCLGEFLYIVLLQSGGDELLILQGSPEISFPMHAVLSK